MVTLGIIKPSPPSSVVVWSTPTDNVCSFRNKVFMLYFLNLINAAELEIGSWLLDNIKPFQFYFVWPKKSRLFCSSLGNRYSYWHALH
jgi:hypothetical protein